MNTKRFTPDLEQNYLIYYSKLNISIGMTLLFFSIDNLFGISDIGFIVAIFAYAVEVICFITTIYYLFIGNRFSSITMSKNAWTGTFNDEFLNSVNLVAYKVAIFMVMIICFIGVLGGRFIEKIDASSYSYLILAVSFVAYGVTALRYMRDNDE